MSSRLTSVLVIDHLAFRVRNHRILLEGLRKMGRLDDKFAKAGGVVQRVEQKIETRLDAIIAREDQLTQKTDRVFDRHGAPIEEADKALDALDRKLDLLSNGGPDGPLPGSDDSEGAAAFHEAREKLPPAPVSESPEAIPAPIPDGRTFGRMG